MTTQDKVVASRKVVHFIEGIGKVEAKGMLHSLSGQTPYFSFECSPHDAAKYVPELETVRKIHLASEDGVPMHFTANAAFYLKEKNDTALAKLMNITKPDARDIIGEFMWYEKELLDKSASKIAKFEAAFDAAFRSVNAPIKGRGNAVLKLEEAIKEYNQFVKKGGMFSFFPADAKTITEIRLYRETSGFYPRNAGISQAIKAGKRLREKLNSIKKQARKNALQEQGMISQGFIKDLFLSCFQSCFKRQAEKALEELKQPDLIEEYDCSEEEPCLMVDGEVSQIVEVRNSDYLLSVTTGSAEYHVAENSESAGEAAERYWEDMAENDPSEFSLLIGEETLVCWGLGQSAGPGSVKVNSLQEWLNLTSQYPEEDFATYDGKERTGKINEALAQELGFDFSGSEDGWLDVVLYRSN